MGGPPPQGMPPMDPNAGGMQVQASYEEVSDLNRYIRDIASLLRWELDYKKPMFYYSLSTKKT